MRYYIADQHFFHRSLITKMDHRDFPEAETMNEYMIEKWNSKVRRNDETVILGDFALADGSTVNELLKRLNGKKYLIRGNHDSYFLDDPQFDPSLFGWIRDYSELRDNRRTIVLCHYPVMCYNGQYRRMPDGSARTFMLYGHVHNTHDEILTDRMIQMTQKTEVTSPDGSKTLIPCQMINCFCMFSDYTPLSLDEWIETDRLRRAEMRAAQECVISGG